MRTIHVYPPLGGIGRKTGYQQQPPFQSYDSVNFWPVDAKTGRKISAVRPAFSPFATVSGQCTLLAPVSGLRSSHPFNSFAAGVAGDLYYWNGATMSAATGAQADEIDTDRMVSADSVINKLYITKSGAKPIVFNYADGTAATLVETVGTCPSDARIAVQWQGALWLAGFVAADPQLLFGSRVGEPRDWDASVGLDDQFGAFTSAADYKGVIGAPITALIPQHRDAMIVSTFHGTQILRGHPRQGGLFEPLSTQYVLGQSAWTMTPDNTVYYMSPKGLMQVPPNFGAVPVAISQGSVPDELLGLTYEYGNPTITLRYDPRWNGIHIFDRNDSGAGWFYDLESGGFHRVDSSMFVWASCDFPGGMTENTSSVLFGDENGIQRIDRFGEETRHSAMIAGPVRLGDTTNQRHLIQSLRMIMGRDTPDADYTGSVHISVGADSQDAVNKMLQGRIDYSVTLADLEANGGLCHPRVAGVAAAIGIESPAGDLAWELIELDTIPAGANRMQRAPQLPVSGVPATIVDFPSEFSEDIWTGYQEATPTTPAEDLVDVTLFFDLSQLASGWWDQVGPLGYDIRATDNLNNPLPLDLLYFDRENQEGTVAVKCTQLASGATPIRFWTGAAALLPDADSTYGQYNAYDEHWRGFWPNGTGNDRTRYLTHVTSSANITPNDVDGPVGMPATDYNQNNQAWSQVANIATSQPDLVNIQEFMFVFGGKYPSAANNSPSAMAFHQSSTILNGLVPLITGATTPNVFCRAKLLHSSGSELADSLNTALSTDWNHFAGIWRGLSSSRSIFLNGEGGGTDSDFVSIGTPLTSLFLGAESSLNGASSYVYLAVAQLHTLERSAAWCRYQYLMFDQGNFWDVETDFDEQNPPPEEIVTGPACPTGTVAYSETGTWTGYASVSVPSALDTQPDYTVFVDLAEMPADWWTNVETDGADIRATDQDNVILPLDVVDFDHGAETGFAAVKLRQVNGPVTTLKLWTGNSSAVSVPACASVGRYAAYDLHWRAFWPYGSGSDRTQNQFNLTALGGVTAGGVLGPSGGLATLFNTSSVLQGAFGTTATPIEPPYSLITAGLLFNSASQTFNWRTLGQLFKLNAQGISTMMAQLNVYYHPTIGFEGRVGGLGIWNNAYSRRTGENLMTDWWTAAFVVSDDGLTRPVWFNDETTFGGNTKYFDSQAVDRVHLGGSITQNDYALPYRYPGRLALSGIRDVAVSSAWMGIYYDMLDQATFWGSWTWQADSEALT